MIFDVKKPFEVSVEKFPLQSKKDEVNPYMIGKLLRKRYESLGFSVVKTDNFETSLLIEFVRKYKFLDKYIKVKLGEYRQNKNIEEYNKQILQLLTLEDVQKLLFVCRACSYLGDPSFPDFLISKGSEVSLRYIYTGDELISGKTFFILLASCLLNSDIKFSAMDFTDYAQPEKLDADVFRILEGVIQTLSKNLKLRSVEEDGIDLSFLKKWLEEKLVNPEDATASYNRFIQQASAETKLKEILGRFEKLDTSSIETLPKPEKLTALRNALGINMMEANDVINIYETLKR